MLEDCCDPFQHRDLRCQKVILTSDQLSLLREKGGEVSATGICGRLGDDRAELIRQR
jgi:hypothetical protein